MKPVARYTFAIIFLCFALAAGNLPAADKPDYVSDKPEAKADVKTGWHPLLKASGNFSLTHSDHLVGVPDGLKITMGLMINAGLDYLHPKGHMWSSALDYNLNYNYTDTLDRFTKGLDAFNFITSYLYQIPKVPQLGPFASFTLKTSIFKGYDVRAADTVVVKQDRDGTETDRYTADAKSNIALTGYFAPTTLRESLGLFGDLIGEQELKIQMRGGVGAWEIFTRGGYTPADNATTPELEIKALQDSVQLGGEFNLTVSGVVRKYVSYTLRAGLMYPFYVNADTPLSGFDLLNIEIEYMIGFAFAKWISLDYAFKAYHIPMIYDGWQIQNGLFLSVTANII